MIYETPTIETDRLILRRGILEDYQKVYEYDFTKLRNINGEFEFVKQDLKKIECFVDVIPETYDWIMYLKETGEPIGNVVAESEEKDISAISLAFNTHPNYWRHGYTYEAVIEIMRFLFEQGYKNILCGYDEGNIKSKGINQKIGFIQYKIKEDAWRKKGIPITTYTNIMSKERFYELYGLEKKQYNL